MIVQSNPTGDAHFVMTMSEHTALAGKFAAHFGNEAFEPVQPRDLMLHVVTHHDAGWQELDSNPQLDTTTGLPYNLVQTPFEWIIKTSSASPDFNAAYHPFCELLSSMHSWGLYNGRYGLSDKVLLDSLSADFRPAVDEMLEYERARQARLIACLKHNHESARWVEEGGGHRCPWSPLPDAIRRRCRSPAVPRSSWRPCRWRCSPAGSGPRWCHSE